MSAEGPSREIQVEPITAPPKEQPAPKPKREPVPAGMIERTGWPGEGPLPPIPDECYPAGAVPLD